MKQLFIAHRGNIGGRIEEKENHPDYILRAMDLGYDVEIDVWLIEGVLFLGHDKPQYAIEYSFLDDPRLWIHCKNVGAMEILSSNPSLNLFAHKDDIAITTKGWLWTAPGYVLTSRSIAVMPELVQDWDTGIAYGVCTDHPLVYGLTHKNPL